MQKSLFRIDRSVECVDLDSPSFSFTRCCTQKSEYAFSSYMVNMCFRWAKPNKLSNKSALCSWARHKMRWLLNGFVRCSSISGHSFGVTLSECVCICATLCMSGGIVGVFPCMKVWLNIYDSCSTRQNNVCEVQVISACINTWCEN